MRMRTLSTVLIGCLLAAAAAAAAVPVKRYTLPAGSQKVYVGGTYRPFSPGTLTVLLPTAWRLRTYDYGTWARDTVHTSVSWSVGSSFEPAQETLDGIRRHQVALFEHPRDVWGPNTGTIQQVGDSFLSLPVGKVWRQTLELVPPDGKGGWATRSYSRAYWLDRGVVRAHGIERHLFMILYVGCRHEQCAAHNAQLAAIMRSVRLSS